ncbi:ABC transporter substrate-binding protein [Bradyrhizobium manausense]|uniref:ABC transporter substrate-binding protein n=1 Tax=Bradyrhizobium manausense TaxID=989370 RepID=UPI001BAB492C|nr:ABC transporter substrate-binding protein [Bradyrhizobium manausense]MBR1092616.1 ABC transporter substrate-binding protein [Bradyrhizobium manausense]
MSADGSGPESLLLIAELTQLIRCRRFAGLACWRNAQACDHISSQILADTLSWMIRRRDFLAFAGGAVLLPRPSLAKQQTPIRRISILGLGVRNAGNDAYFTALTKSLASRGWIEGKNIILDFRWAENDEAKLGLFSDEILDLKPDVIVAPTTRVAATFKQKTRTIPVVFVAVGDPVASGLVDSLAHPGANITGFSNFEPTLFQKAVEILKEISPGLMSVSWMYDVDGISHSYGGPDIEAAAYKLGIKFFDRPVRNASEIEALIANQGETSGAGLVVAGEPFMISNLNLIVTLTIRFRIPAIYFFRAFTAGGGLVSYGNDLVDAYWQAGLYVDRILNGDKPESLPVQAPSKFELIINQKVASEIGLSVPPTLLARADEVIE